MKKSKNGLFLLSLLVISLFLVYGCGIGGGGDRAGVENLKEQTASEIGPRSKEAIESKSQFALNKDELNEARDKNEKNRKSRNDTENKPPHVDIIKPFNNEVVPVTQAGSNRYYTTIEWDATDKNDDKLFIYFETRGVDWEADQWRLISEYQKKNQGTLQWYISDLSEGGIYKLRATVTDGELENSRTIDVIIPPKQRIGGGSNQ